MPLQLAKGLKVLAEQQRWEIVHLSEKFARDTPDPIWIRTLGAEGGWVIVSADPRISRGTAERAAWQESRITAFFFGAGWTNQSFWGQAADTVRWWPKIVLEAQNCITGSGYLMQLKAKEFQKIYEPS
jgi:hypothetical protein